MLQFFRMIFFDGKFHFQDNAICTILKCCVVNEVIYTPFKKDPVPDYLFDFIGLFGL